MAGTGAAERPWYDPKRDPVSRMVEIKHGDRDVTELNQLTLPVRRDCDTEYLRRASELIRAAAARDVPFLVYFNHSLMHMPVIPRAEFKGQTGQDDWADSLLELDTDFGTLLDLLDELDLAGDTVVVFAGDNGPEDVLLWRGTPGYWEGSYFAGGEGNLRTPCIVRWPGRVPAGPVSDDIMHVTDWFTTLLRAAGTREPDDRVIDGIDQLPWLTGQQAGSAREGYLYWMGPELYGGQVTQLQARPRRAEVPDRSGRQATVPAHRQPDHQPPGTGAAEHALPAFLDRHPLQPAAGRIPGQR